MDAKNVIVLTGFMGSGKSRIGQGLAGRLGLPFHDLDAVIEQQEQKSISEIFKSKGEKYFRGMELECFRNLVEQAPAVVALGGGAIQQEGIRVLLRKHALTVYLDVPMETLFLRLKKDKKRPLLRDGDGNLLDDDRLRSRISELLTKREPLYRTADLTVSVHPQWSRNRSTIEVIRQLKKHAPTSLTEYFR
jgi:shikimate kinase